MRPVLQGDVIAAAQAVLRLPEGEREAALRAMMARAAAADAYRKRLGRAHPLWGNGSLMAVARRGPLPPAPSLSDREFCRCLALVYEVLIAWRSERAVFSRRRS
ncbi:hypothetical protein [Actibacterium sp. MT2.3-13A]|uniref:DUF7742 family protein n=1 Tax=Actibacterium sp. MT2.3-13A TaxID=2828332 RepID=UPI001BA94112|nr:hypothetical protein [Actibacterium sp. MT2.3-13A]